MKRTLALFLSALLLLALLTGCGSKSAPRDSAAGSDYMTANQSYAKTDESFAYDEPELPTPDAENGYWDSDDSRTLTGGMTAPGDAKMIYRASIEVQTQDYTTSESAITARNTRLFAMPMARSSRNTPVSRRPFVKARAMRAPKVSGAPSFSSSL